MRYLIPGIVVILCGVQQLAPIKNGKVSLVFKHQFTSKTLDFQGGYLSEKGDSLYIDVVRYYISKVELKKDGKTLYQESNSYHLVDLEMPGSDSIVLKNVPAGAYDAVCFMVGTDSTCNVSGANSGDLDPSLGMYWAWNSGYINVKIEGRSNACATRHHAFEFHIGGYMPPYQTVRQVELPLKHFQVSENTVCQIDVQADLALFFKHIQLRNTNQVMMPSKLAAELASYFTEIFRLE